MTFFCNNFFGSVNDNKQINKNVICLLQSQQNGALDFTFVESVILIIILSIFYNQLNLLLIFRSLHRCLCVAVVYDDELTNAFFDTVSRLMSKPPSKTLYMTVEKR